MLKWAVEIKEGKILSIVKEEDWQGKSKLGHIVDYEEAVVMPGLIDVYVIKSMYILWLISLLRIYVSDF